MLTGRCADFVIFLGTTFRAYGPYITSLYTCGCQFFYNNVIVLTMLFCSAKQACAIVIDMLFRQWKLCFRKYFVTCFTTNLFVTLLYTSGFVSVNICFFVLIDFTCITADIAIVVTRIVVGVLANIAGLATQIAIRVTIICVFVLACKG